MTNQLYKCRFVSIFILLLVEVITAQNVDLESIVQGKPFKLSGAVAANSIFYNSNQDNARAPFTYFVQGSLNASIYQFSMPISYSYSNQGEQFNYQLPYKFNRLSLHPKYRWIQGHVGDATMSFSPYTLAGHQFTGGGLELTPKGSFKISAMAGRLLKATEDDEDNQTIPAFYRFGYGLKLDFQKEKYNIALIGFSAKDKINSISIIPEEKGVLPQENLVVSLGGSYKVNKELKFNAEYASTAITQDLRGRETNNSQGISGLLFNNRSTTEYYNAFNAGFDYKFDKYLVGVTYERIEPGYETLGAYFFNSDFENITINSSTNLFKNKLSLAFNIGYQRDDLDNQKEQATNRTVGSVNANFKVSERTNITGSYSNFTTFTNAKVNQFDIINDDNLIDNITDALDYRQLSQNANINVSHVVSKKENLQQSLNVNYALADVFNEQDGIVRVGDASTFHNINTSYTLGLPKKSMNITTAINGTLNTIGTEDATTWGPTLSVNKKIFDKKLNAGIASSYNQSKSTTTTTNVTNFRANASYLYKEKHNFNLTAIQLFRNSTVQEDTNELTITFGYNYNFNIGVPKFKKRKKQNTKEEVSKEEKDKKKEEAKALAIKEKEEKRKKKEEAKALAIQAKEEERKKKEEVKALALKEKEEKRKKKEDDKAIVLKAKEEERKKKEEAKALELQAKEEENKKEAKELVQEGKVEGEKEEETKALIVKEKERKNKKTSKEKEKREKNKISKKEEKRKRKEAKEAMFPEEDFFKLAYKEHVFEGTHNEVSNQIVELISSPTFYYLRFKTITDDLNVLEDAMRSSEEKKGSVYRKATKEYLDYAYEQKELETKYNTSIYNSLKKLHTDASKLDYIIETKYLSLLTEITEKQKREDVVSEQDLKVLKLSENQYKAHKWMLGELELVTENSVAENTGMLKEFKEKNTPEILSMMHEKKKDSEIENYLLFKLVKFYHKKGKEVKE